MKGFAPREFIADHLDVDALADLEPDVADEVLVNPGLEFTHPRGHMCQYYSTLCTCEYVPEGSLATITGGAVAGLRNTTVVEGCRRGAGLARLGNGLSSRRITTGGRGRSSLLWDSVIVVVLERHAGNFLS